MQLQRTETQEDRNKKLLTVWTLITSLNLTLFCIAQLEPTKMRHQQKQRYMNLRTCTNNFLSLMQQKNTIEEKELVESTSFDNVAIIMETIGMMAHVHPDQQDWFLNEVTKLVHVSVNRQNSKA
jgi:hypothetical protein